MSTPSNKLEGRHLFKDKPFTASFIAGEDIGYIDTAPDYPLAPIATTGYPLYLSANETVKHITLAKFDEFFGISEVAARSGKQVTVRFFGIVWLPVGAHDVVFGDYVQITPTILDGSAATKTNCKPGDIIPAFAVVQHIRAKTNEAAGLLVLDNAIEVLKILQADLFVGATAAAGSSVTALTILEDGFSSDTVPGSLTVASGEIALCNDAGTQGIYSTKIKTGDAIGGADLGGFLLLSIWQKIKNAISSPWVVGQSLRSGAARTDAITWEEIPVILRGY